MEEKTHFRQGLISNLAEMAFDEQLERFQRENPVVENAKEEIVGNWLDYYTSELLAYSPFRVEFKSEELQAIRAFTEELSKLRTEEWGQRWKDIQIRARILLQQLTG